MPASKNKSQIGTFVPKELKTELEQIAREQDRSLSNLLTVILKNYVKNQKSQNPFSDSENPQGEGN